MYIEYYLYFNRINDTLHFLGSKDDIFSVRGILPERRVGDIIENESRNLLFLKFELSLRCTSSCGCKII